MKGDRARAILVKDNKILLIQRLRRGEEYYVLPGGHVEEGETLETTVMRELKEETSLEAKLIRKVTSFTDKDGTTHYIYEFEYISGEPHLAPDSPELIREKDNNIYTPMWIDIADVANLAMWPAEKNMILADYFQQKGVGK